MSDLTRRSRRRCHCSTVLVAAHQLAENGSSARGSQAERPTQQEAGSLRGQKRQQSSDEVEPSPKRALQTAEATSQGHERSIPQPLIDWQPAMTSR